MGLNGDILNSQTQSDPTPQMPTATANSTGVDFGNILSGALTGGIGSLIGAGTGLLLQGEQNQNQVNQQQKLTNIQTQAQEQLMQDQENTQFDMWQKTNYPAQVQELEQAGLNPALLYGKGGGGGTTIGGSMPSVTGGTAQNNMASMAQLMGNNMQMAIQQAQIRNIDADTALKQASLPNVPKTGQNIDASTANQNASTASLLQGITNQQTQNTLMQMQTYATSVTADNVLAQTDKINQEIALLKNDVTVSDSTIDNKIQGIRQTALNTYLQGNLIKSNIQVNNEQINQMSQNILQGWQSLNLQQQQQRVQQELMKAQTQTAGATTNLEQTEAPLLKWQTMIGGVNAIANLGQKLQGQNKTFNTNNYIPVME